MDGYIVALSYLTPGHELHYDRVASYPTLAAAAEAANRLNYRADVHRLASEGRRYFALTPGAWIAQVAMGYGHA